MYCNNCRIHLSDNVKFCPNCGMAAVPILEVAAEPETPEASPALNPQQPADPFVKAPEPFDPILDMPQPTAPMYTPVPVTPTDPPAVYDDPAYGNPGYDPNGYAQQAIPQPIINSIFTWGLLGTIFAFQIPILGIIFSIISRKKSNECLGVYGYLSGKAKAGRILSTVGLIGGIVMTVLLTLYVLFIIAIIGFAANY